VGEDGGLIAGHAGYSPSRQLGIAEIPCAAECELVHTPRKNFYKKSLSSSERMMTRLLPSPEMPKASQDVEVDPIWDQYVRTAMRLGIRKPVRVEQKGGKDAD
jgi:hypothetical protein